MNVDVLKRIEDVYDGLGVSSKRLADYLLENENNISTKSINDIASDCEISVATVSRFAGILGYKSFSQLKWALVNKIDFSSGKLIEISKNDSPKTVASKTLSFNVETLNETFRLMNDADLKQATNLLVNANTVAFFGMGGSNIVALDAYHKFLRVPLTILHDSEYHMALMQSSRLSSNDCAVVISHTGNDTDTIDIAESLRDNHVPMIVITSFANSKLATFGNVNFYSVSNDSQLRSEALISLTSQLAINDCLYMLVAQHFGKKAENVLTRIRKTINKKHTAH